ncbi:helix-turn-helix domain-containing protein [Bacillus wiedmannii]|uniref:helix-turn-helix domain-containing protein n=1 Tax=Bacillus wiedmannii TaxID=1890302 RepID=UPI003D1FCB92
MGNWLNRTKEFHRMPFHEQIRTKRLVDGFTQRELSSYLDIPQSTLARVEKCQVLLPHEYMMKVCAYLHGEEKGSVGKKESKVEEYSIGFSPLDGKQDLPHVLDLSTENIEMVVGCLKLKVLHSTDDYLLYEPFMVTIVQHNCPSPKCVAMGRLQDFYRVLFTPNGIELTEKKGV